MPVTIKTGVGGGSVTLDSGTGVLDTTLTLPNINGTVLYSDANGTSNIANITATTLTVSGNVTGNLTIAGTVVMASSFKRNRIINGNMLIDQRNAGANVTPASGAYTLDRWGALVSQSSKFSVQQNAASVTPPAGFKNYLGVTSLSSYSITSTDNFSIYQIIEGYNVADLGWGASGAQTVTLSFWVRSSLTGTFGGVISNQYTTSGRYYPFTYTISVANTWEQKTITITGDVTGTWGSTSGNGIVVIFGLGTGSTYSGTAGAWSGTYVLGATGATSVVGTSGATFYITGAQLEVGTKATPYEMQIYSDQLAQCQRYYFKTFNQGVAPAQGVGVNKGEWCTARVVAGANPQRNSLILPVVMRTTPTTTYYNPVNANAQAYNGDQATDCSATQNLSSAQGDSKVTMYTINTAAGSAGEAIIVHITASAEI
jgi:cytoskeletal protein CcmA (bactofilin family)